MNTRLRLAAVVAVLLAVLFVRHSKHQGSVSSEPASSRISQTATLRDTGLKRDLSKDDAAGGHTLRKHVGRSDQQLRERLEDEPNIAAASSYSDRETAEFVVGSTLREEDAKIQRWLQHTGGHPNLVLDYVGDAARPIGRTLRRGDSSSQPCAQAVVILKWDGSGEYHVLTSYPECR